MTIQREGKNMKFVFNETDEVNVIGSHTSVSAKINIVLNFVVNKMILPELKQEEKEELLKDLLARKLFL